MSNTLLISINDTLSFNRHYAKIFKCEMSILDLIKCDSNDDLIYPMIERDCSLTNLKTIADIPPFPSTHVVLSKKILNIMTIMSKDSIMVENIIFDKNINAVCSYDNANSWQMWIQDNLHKMSSSICQYKDNYCLTPITNMIDSDYRSFVKGMEILCRYNITTDNILPSATVVSIENSTTSKAGSIITQIMNTMMPEIAFNSTITSSTDKMSESIFSDYTASWTEKGINLTNNAMATLTNTSFNTTYNSQKNIFDESYNDTSLVVAPYMGIITTVAASIAVVIGAGVTWYFRHKNAKKAKLKQYIAEIEAEKLTAEINEDVTTENNAIIDNDHTVVDMTGVSYAEEGALV